jgi:enoyl-CoA hydratase/carnithine racemase
VTRENELLEADFLGALRLPIAENSDSVVPTSPVLVRLGEGPAPGDLHRLQERVRSLPGVVVGLGSSQAPTTPLVDVVAEPDDPIVDAVIHQVSAAPQAASALAMLLRGSEARSIGDGLAAESAVYSMLQAGPEFAGWIASRTPRSPTDDDSPAVRVERDGSTLAITLTRPHVHNAFNARMRDELLDALAIAWTDDAVREVVLRGDGPSFCSGGDLDEFGTFPDPVTAHLVRLARSVGRAIATLSDRVVARIHGACMGSGIELPAFAGRVVAAPDTRIALPEVTMGLVPGAGGTTSLPRRIGRHRTAELALSGMTIDAVTALDWGLVDAIEDD